MANQLIRTDVWDPFLVVRDLQEEMNRTFDRSLTPALWKNGKAFWAPSVDLKEEKERFVVKADLPGIKKEDLTVNVEGDVLTIKGERKESQEKKEKDYYYSERFEGSFLRTLELPTKVKADAVKASYKDGVLEIALPKDEAAKPREVKVQIQ